VIPVDRSNRSSFQQKQCGAREARPDGGTKAPRFGVRTRERARDPPWGARRFLSCAETRGALNEARSVFLRQRREALFAPIRPHDAPLLVPCRPDLTRSKRGALHPESLCRGARCDRNYERSPQPPHSAVDVTSSDLATLVIVLAYPPRRTLPLLKFHILTVPSLAPVRSLLSDASKARQLSLEAPCAFPNLSTCYCRVGVITHFFLVSTDPTTPTAVSSTGIGRDPPAFGALGHGSSHQA